MPQIHWPAVVAAAVAAFVIGGLWYSPVMFHRVWKRETGLTDEQLSKGSPAMTYGVSFVLALVAAGVFAMFLGPAPKLDFAVGAGLAAGLGWVATSFGINYLFEKKSFKLWLVNAGYHVAQFAAIGAILGAWH
jgi:hypothetical protein